MYQHQHSPQVVQVKVTSLHHEQDKNNKAMSVRRPIRIFCPLTLRLTLLTSILPTATTVSRLILLNAGAAIISTLFTLLALVSSIQTRSTRNFHVKRRGVTFPPAVSQSYPKHHPIHC
eukprot:scaffold316_cov188-Alexandrium_tamarense.AAC.16